MARPPTKAQRIADTLAERIAAGEPAAASWLPSERDLSEAFDADRSTVRRALQMLERRGLIELHAGIGAQVLSDELLRRDSSDVTAQVDTWRGFHVSAYQSGKAPYTDTDVQEVEIDPVAARWLGVPTGTRVVERARVQGVDGQPVQLSTTWIAPAVSDRLPIVREVNTGPGGMLSRMEEIGYRLRFEDTVTCRLPLDDEQEKLKIDPHHPVLTVWRRCYSRENHILEATFRVIVGERHELIYRYDKSS
jgi:GntR family transcriptional regulator